MLVVLQANVGRGTTATSQIIKFADSHKIDIIMLQEPHTRDDRVVADSSEFTVHASNSLQQIANGNQPQSSSQQPISQQRSNPKANHLSSPLRPKAACLIRNNVTNYLFDQEISNVNMAVVAFDSVVLVSLYSNAKRPDKSDRPMTDDLRSIDIVLKKYQNKPIAILMDSNCHHATFGGNRCDKRGEELIDYLQEKELICLNQPEQGHTYEKTVNNKTQKTFIDLTVANKKFGDRLHSWTIEREAMSTEHAAILIEPMTRAHDRPRFPSLNLQRIRFSRVCPRRSVFPFDDGLSAGVKINSIFLFSRRPSAPSY